MKQIITISFVIAFVSGLFAQIPKPTQEQIEWADCKIGAIIHFDIYIYEPEYQWRGQWDYDPDPKILIQKN